MNEFNRLLEIMHRLRKECPWDKEQDLKSLRKYMLEEAYEAVSAIDDLEESGDAPLIEELGDVLLQVVFQSELLSETHKQPVIEDVIRTLNEKLVRRHPHVFGDACHKTSETEVVLKRWDEIKKSEKGDSKSESLMSGIARSLSALQLAKKLGDRSKKIKFDWNAPSEVWKQVEAELEELKNAKTTDEIEDELGDVFFSLVQWARHKKIDAEVSLNRTNQKFLKRFHAMEALAKERNQDFAALSTDEKEKLWIEVKSKLGSTKS